MHAVPLRQLFDRLAVAVRRRHCCGLVRVEPDLGLSGAGRPVGLRIEVALAREDCKVSSLASGFE